jgi:CrcB protein
MNMILYVAIGSALGGAGRFMIGSLMERLLGSSFPAGTLFVNVSGSLLLGAITGSAMQTGALAPEVRALLVAGFCGGYTTFSTFSYETLVLLKHGDWPQAALYVTASVLLSVAGTFLGFALGHEVFAWSTRA